MQKHLNAAFNVDTIILKLNIQMINTMMIMEIIHNYMIMKMALLIIGHFLYYVNRCVYNHMNIWNIYFQISLMDLVVDGINDDIYDLLNEHHLVRSLCFGSILADK